MLAALAANFSSHHVKLKQLGLTTLKAQLQFEALVKGLSQTPTPVKKVHSFQLIGKVDKSALTNKQKSIYICSDTYIVQ